MARMKRLTRGQKQVRARALRDAAVHIVETGGQFRVTAHGAIPFAWIDSLRMILTTPEQRLLPPDAYQVELWDGRTKVLRLHWTRDDATVDIGLWKRGEWEETLLSRMPANRTTDVRARLRVIDGGVAI